MNIHRNPNPFSSSEELDWVHIKNPVRRDSDENAENVIVTGPSVPQGGELLDMSMHPEIDHDSADSHVAERPHETARDIKTPPPIPRKPTSLISKENRPDTALKSVRSERDMGQNPLNISQSPGTVYPQNRPGAQATSDGGRNTTDLLNDDADEDIRWKPLLPQ